MLYRYPEQKRTTGEIVVGNKRYDTYTGEELPPLPYIYQTAAPQQTGSTAKKASANTAQAKASSAKTTAAKTSANAEQQERVTAKQLAEAAAAAAKAEAELVAAKAKAQAQELKRKEVKAGYEKNTALLGSNFEAEKTSAAAANDEAMKQLYIAYMEGIKNMPQQTALWGAGGESESLKAQKRINYEDNRAKQNKEYMGALGEIQRKYNSDLMELEERYLKQLMNI